MKVKEKGGKEKEKGLQLAVASGDVLWLYTQGTLGSITSGLA